MVDEISENLYKIEMPFPQKPFKALNSHVIKTSHRNKLMEVNSTIDDALALIRYPLDADSLTNFFHVSKLS
jgi:hypothetical protein